jgi:dipeptidyl aminopeptidase/acylaminoacyl peptidase
MNRPLLFRAMGAGAAAVALSGASAMAADAPAKHSAEAFYQTVDFRIGGPDYAFSQDGERVIITSDETGVYNAYALDLKTDARTPLTQSTASATFAISYFPDGERFLYTSDGGGDELNHVYVDGPDMEPMDLTPGENLKAGFVGWIDGGAAFIVETNERDNRYFDLYRYDAATFERDLVFANDLGLGGVTVSRGGALAAGVKARTSADDDIYLVSLAGDAEPQNISAHEGNISHAVYDFTPEGDKLVYGTDEHGEFTQAWTYDVATGEKAPLIEDDWDISFVFFSPSGRYRVHGANVDASTAVTILDRQSDKTLKLPKNLPQGDLGNVRFTEDEKTLAFTVNAPTSPSNVFTADIKGRKFKKHTDAMNPEINPADLVDSEVVRYESFDGLKIPSILYKPKGASAENPAPALVFVHGGPGGQTRTGYNAMVQHLVNHGYAVLGANNRGSSGYGKTFFHMDDKKHGEDDLQDIVMGRAYLESLDWVDKDKIGIIGGSYGGYMVMAALAFEPEAFDAGVNIFGVTNWVRTLTSIPPWWESFKEALYDEMGDPATDGERHRRISPLFHAENVTKPVLVIQGANDPRVLQVESDEMVAALRANGVPVEYVLFPDEGHGFRSRANRITASDAYVAFLDKYLRGEAAGE